ncbi:MAG: hypothetical protein WAV05_19670 [Anaerolineales bacterium]
MKRLFILLITGSLVFFLGVALAGNLNLRNVTLAGTEEPPMVDGLPVLPAENQQSPQEVNAVSAGSTYFRMYSAFEFKPAHSELTFSPFGAAMYAVSIPLGGQSFKCPLDLPNGAQVTQVSFYVVDNSSTYNMTLQFYRTQPPATTSQTEIGYVTTAGLPVSPNIQTVTIYGDPILTTIDYQNYAYHLRYEPVITGNSHMLIGAQVQYTFPVGFLPAIHR